MSQKDGPFSFIRSHSTPVWLQRPYWPRIMMTLLLIFIVCGTGWSGERSPTGTEILELYAKRVETPSDRETLEAVRLLLDESNKYHPKANTAHRTFEKNINKPWVADLLQTLYQEYPLDRQVQTLVVKSIIDGDQPTKFQNAIPGLMRNGSAVTQNWLFDWIKAHPRAQPPNWIDLLQWLAATANEPDWHSAKVRRKAIGFLLDVDSARWDKHKLYDQLLQELSEAQPGYMDEERGNDRVARVREPMELLAGFYGGTEQFWQAALGFCKNHYCFQALDEISQDYLIPESMHPWLRERTESELHDTAIRMQQPLFEESDLQPFYRLLVKSRDRDSAPSAPASYALSTDDQEAYLPLLDHAYQIWAMADLARPIAPPLLQWTDRVLSATPATQSRHVRDIQRALIDLHLRSYFLLNKADITALDHLFALKGYKQAPTQFRVQLLKTAIHRVGAAESSDYFIRNIRTITDSKPELIHAVLDAVSGELNGHGKKPVKWSEQTHNTLIELSRDQYPGNYEPTTGLSVREEAWSLRMQVFDDEMPRKEALTMSLWRNRALKQNYHERYFWTWASLLVPAILIAFGRRKIMPPIIVLSYPVLLLGLIWCVAVIASLGHNYANTRALLSVLQGGYYLFMATVVGAWLTGVVAIFRRYGAARSHHPNGQ